MADEAKKENHAQEPRLAEPRPAEAGGAEPRPAESRPAEGRPAEGRPPEGRPREGRPHEGRPHEGRGGESRGPREGGKEGPGKRGRRGFYRKKKVCRFCADRVDYIDYKKADSLMPFIQERGKILPRRLTGTCSRHQRWLAEAIQRARNIALLPFGVKQ
jgi:small subunit ribosomal protein S18